MTAPTAIPLEDRFAPAIDTVNGWRGRCLASFARAEAAVSEALVTLGATDGKAALPLLVGQRYALLAARLEARGGGAEAVCAIRAFAAHDDLRVFLCHGVSRILLDRRGTWQATFAIVAQSEGAIVRRVLLIDADEANGIARELQRDQHRLGQLLARAVPPEPEPPDRGVTLRIANLQR